MKIIKATSNSFKQNERANILTYMSIMSRTILSIFTAAVISGPVFIDIYRIMIFKITCEIY